MAVASTMYNAQCQDCGRSFYDATGQAPCPSCRSVAVVDLPAALQATKSAAPPKSATKTSGKSASNSSLLGVGALAIGIPLWLEGARTTRDGWVLFVNWVLDRLGMPYAIPSSTLWPWWLAIGMLALLGYAYSHIEVNQTPISVRPWRVTRVWQVWVVWVVFIISDVGTMYLGARSPRESDPAILHQIAGVALVAAGYAILITFVPERLVMFGWRKLRG
jgi:hypothetical protein